MKCRRLVVLLFSMGGFFGTTLASAGEIPEVFSTIRPDPVPLSRPEFLETFTVTLDMESIRQPAQTLTLNLPDREREVVELIHWEPRQGYIQIPDPNDPTGFNTITIPDPNARPEDFWWRWYGKSASYTVALTVVGGIVAGRVTGARDRYAVDPTGDGATKLGRVNSDYWQTHHDEGRGDVTQAASPANQNLFRRPIRWSAVRSTHRRRARGTPTVLARYRRRRT